MKINKLDQKTLDNLEANGMVKGEYPKLYSRDSKDNLREWCLKVEKSSIVGLPYSRISCTGIVGGKIMISKPHFTRAKNVGRANATTYEEQMHSEIISIYTRRLEGGWVFDSAQAGKVEEFSPMLAGTLSDSNMKKLVKAQDFPLFFQPKLDGIRCIVNNGEAKSRNAKPIVSVPHVLSEFLDLPSNIHLDGELYNHSKDENFNKIVSVVKKTKVNDEMLAESKQYIRYFVYDMYDENNPDMIFEERMKYLENLLEGKEYTFWTITKRCESTTPEKIQWWSDEFSKKWIDLGYEGAMLRANTKYEQKRTYNLLKIKTFIDEEFEILEVIEGKGNWAGIAKSLRCKTEDGTEFNAGCKGTQDENRELLMNAKKVIGKQATITYQNLSKDGVPRFPVVKAIHWEERW